MWQMSSHWSAKCHDWPQIIFLTIALPKSHHPHLLITPSTSNLRTPAHCLWSSVWQLQESPQRLFYLLPRISLSTTLNMLPSKRPSTLVHIHWLPPGHCLLSIWLLCIVRSFVPGPEILCQLPNDITWKLLLMHQPATHHQPLWACCWHSAHLTFQQVVLKDPLLFAQEVSVNLIPPITIK